MYCIYLPENKTIYKKFLLEVAREWITVDSKDAALHLTLLEFLKLPLIMMHLSGFSDN